MTYCDIRAAGPVGQCSSAPMFRTRHEQRFPAIEKFDNLNAASIHTLREGAGSPLKSMSPRGP